MGNSSLSMPDGLRDGSGAEIIGFCVKKVVIAGVPKWPLPVVEESPVSGGKKPNVS